MKRLVPLLLLLCCAGAMADDDEITTPAPPFTGWHWYNEPVPEKAPPPQKRPQAPPAAVPDFSKMSPSEQTKVLHEYTMEALNRAILYPSSQNTARFLKWQKFWTDRASMFSQSFAVAQLDNPDLDYNLQFPHYNSMAPVVQARDQTAQKDAIADIASHYGLFFFYKGSDPVGVQMAGVVKDFAAVHHIALIPVSVDGQVAPTVPDSRPDNGQSQSMHISYFPALFLVDPVSRQYHPLAYGFMTQDDLAKRFLNVSTGFKPNF